MTEEMKRTSVRLREYQHRYVREQESFNLSGFLREKLDEEIPDGELPQGRRSAEAEGD